MFWPTAMDTIRGAAFRERGGGERECENERERESRFCLNVDSYHVPKTMVTTKKSEAPSKKKYMVYPYGK